MRRLVRSAGPASTRQSMIGNNYDDSCEKGSRGKVHRSSLKAYVSYLNASPRPQVHLSTLGTLPKATPSNTSSSASRASSIQSETCVHEVFKMSKLKKVLAVILIVSVLTFIALFGRLPALRRTPIGWLYRALCLHLPRGLKTVDRRATGGRVTLYSTSIFRYLFYTQNPVVIVRPSESQNFVVWQPS